MRRNHKQIRTFLTRLHQAFPVWIPQAFAERDLARTMPCLLLASPPTTQSSSRRSVPSAQVLQAVYRFPGQESIIYIHMKNNWFHEKSICQNVCSVNRKYKGIRRHPGNQEYGWRRSFFSLPLIAKERIDKNKKLAYTNCRWIK